MSTTDRTVTAWDEPTPPTTTADVPPEWVAVTIEELADSAGVVWVGKPVTASVSAPGDLLPAWVVIVRHDPADDPGRITVLQVCATEAEAATLAREYMLSEPTKEAEVHRSGTRAGAGWDVREKECGA